MTTYFKRERIEDLIDEVAADPSRAEAVKRNLKQMIEPRRIARVLDRSDRPVIESDDFFDNVPV